MRKLPDFSAVIFDLDGLVLDTEITYFAAWQQTIINMGYPCSAEFCQSLSGLQFDDITRTLHATYGADFNVSAFVALSTPCWREYVTQQGIAIKPGFTALLALLTQQQIPFALATNSPHLSALECLALAGLDGVFTTLIAREHVHNGKPEPDIFLHAAQQLNTPIQQCLIVEDSYNGVLAAYRAGANVIYIPSTLTEQRAAALAFCVMDNLHQLAECLE
ncbi:MAG: HAD family phosphatase [Methylococcales bacterium]|nr:HAD family phosphatase [Methylococcales bacterium]